jgi:hypothetical protein
MSLLTLGAMTLLTLSGCSFGSANETNYFSTSSKGKALEEYKQDLAPSIHAVEQGQNIEDFYPENSLDNKKKNTIRLGLSRDESKALGCDLGDRFDRGAALAYNFDNQKSRVSLHLSVDGPSFSDPSNLELNSVLLRFTHKFQKPSKSQIKKCQFPSKVQGLFGSLYNEFFVRDNYTILDELKDRGLNLK